QEQERGDLVEAQGPCQAKIVAVQEVEADERLIAPHREPQKVADQPLRHSQRQQQQQPALPRHASARGRSSSRGQKCTGGTTLFLPLSSSLKELRRHG